ncbi:putative gustatory receptor 58a [Rhagoletis pomonella]|uniref:putative gustatory receptor 58a n=1 Tax=Rhagoletis pomonella TaxID=28610 RepID=UPI001785B620|nr:putative gustatory receptor 58a [Rhagoletis pomonella]
MRRAIGRKIKTNTAPMNPTFHAHPGLCIIGYFNIYVIFLGLTRFRIDFVAQRVVRSRLVAFYVICVNIATLVFVPISYIYESIDASSILNNNLETFSETVNLLINSGAIAASVLLRGQREGIHLKIAESIISLDRRYFSKMCADKSTDHGADRLLYFKLFALSLQLVAPLYNSFSAVDEVVISEVLQTFYYSYLQSILAATHSMYFYFMWLLHKRFCLLNGKIKDLLHQLQQMPMRGERCEVDILAQRQLDATEALLEISQIHTDLSRLLVRLNVDYEKQILAVLLANLIDSISFGYYLTLAMDGSVDWEFDFDALLFCSYAAILFVDLNLVYWISDMAMAGHNKMAQIICQLQILPPLGDVFEQECEVFVLLLQQRKMDIRVAGMFRLNRQSALGLWIFVLTQVIIFKQFDLESQLRKSKENPLLERFNQFFRIE